MNSSDECSTVPSHRKSATKINLLHVNSAHNNDSWQYKLRRVTRKDRSPN